LTVAELLAFTDGSPDVLLDLHEGLHGTDGRLRAIRHQLHDLRELLHTSSTSRRRW
jgi:hypothetical protein